MKDRINLKSGNTILPVEHHVHGDLGAFANARTPSRDIVSEDGRQVELSELLPAQLHIHLQVGRRVMWNCWTLWIGPLNAEGKAGAQYAGQDRVIWASDSEADEGQDSLLTVLRTDFQGALDVCHAIKLAEASKQITARNSAPAPL
jgi:hypothetical protein